MDDPQRIMMTQAGATLHCGWGRLDDAVKKFAQWVRGFKQTGESHVVFRCGTVVRVHTDDVAFTSFDSINYELPGCDHAAVAERIMRDNKLVWMMQWALGDSGVSRAIRQGFQGLLTWRRKSLMDSDQVNMRRIQCEDAGVAMVFILGFKQEYKIFNLSMDALTEAGAIGDIGVDTKLDAGIDAKFDAGVDAKLDAGMSIGVDTDLNCEVIARALKDYMFPEVAAVIDATMAVWTYDGSGNFCRQK